MVWTQITVNNKAARQTTDVGLTTRKSAVVALWVQISWQCSLLLVIDFGSRVLRNCVKQLLPSTEGFGCEKNDMSSEDNEIDVKRSFVSLTYIHWPCLWPKKCRSTSAELVHDPCSHAGLTYGGHLPKIDRLLSQHKLHLQNRIPAYCHGSINTTENQDCLRRFFLLYAKSAEKQCQTKPQESNDWINAESQFFQACTHRVFNTPWAVFGAKGQQATTPIWSKSDWLWFVPYRGLSSRASHATTVERHKYSASGH